MTTLDSAIFAPLFSDAEISALLTDEAFVRALVDVEKALARAEARVGVIETSAAELIARACANKIDLAALTKGTASSGFPIIALVQELRKQVGAEAAPFIHWGATTQDIMDTACVLQLRSAVNLIRIRLGEIARHLSALADRHRTTILAGRTHGQQALPISFGIKVASWLSLLTGTLGKMAQDIILLAQTEVGEAGESAEAGRGGSSTMPQKSNPITSELILAIARTNASLLSAMHHAQIQEHERATHGWQVEWLTLPQMLTLTGGALKHALYLAKNLQVDAAAMRANITRANDVILAEACVFALARAMPRPKAEELVKKACQAAISEHQPLIEVVKRLAQAEIADDAVDWQALAQPENYLGDTEAIIDGVIESVNSFLA